MEKQICPGCKSDYTIALPIKCKKCNYPFSGTKQEQGRFIGQQVIMNQMAKSTQKLVLALRILFFIWAAGNILILFIFPQDIFGIIQGVAFGAIFLFAALLTNKNPFPSILLALTAFTLFLIATGIGDLSAMLRGIILKLFFIGLMAYCLYNLRRIKNYYGTYQPKLTGESKQ